MTATGTLLLLLLAVLVPAAGLGLLLLLRCCPREPWAALGLGTAAGLAALCLSLSLSLAWDGSFSPVLGMSVLVGLLPGLWLARTSLPRWPRPRGLGWVLLLGALLLAQTVASAPMRGYDAKAIYGIKAKALLHEGSVRGPLFTQRDVVHYHSDYPLGVPLVMATVGWLAGTDGSPERAAAATDGVSWSAAHDQVEAYVPFAVLWVLALVALVGGAIRRRGVTHPAALLLLLVMALPTALAMPFAAGRSWTWAGADLPLILLLTAVAQVALTLLRAPSPGRGLLLLLLCGAAVTVKNDAWLAFLSLGAALLLGALPRARLVTVGSVLLGALLGALLVKAGGRFGVGAPFDEQWLPAVLAATPASLALRAPLVLEWAGNTLSQRGLLLPLLGMAALAVPFGLAHRGPRRVLALFVWLHLLGCTALFLFSPNVVTWHVDTALPRLFAHAFGPGALLLADALITLWRRPSTLSPVPQLPPPR